MLWIGCLLVGFALHADEEPAFWQGYSENTSEESWNQDIHENPDSHPWHTLNRWQGRTNQDKDEGFPTVDLNEKEK